MSKQSKKIYNLETLNEISNGDERFILDMISIFIDNTRDVLSKMETYLERKNYGEFQKLAHSIKSNMHTYGIMEAFQLLLDMEKTAELGNKEELQKKLTMLNTVTGKAITEMEKDYKLS